MAAAAAAAAGEVGTKGRREGDGERLGTTAHRPEEHAATLGPDAKEVS